MIGRALVIGRALAICLALPAVAAATTGDDAAPPRAFTVLCTLTETCHVTGGCASLPAPGEVIVHFDGTTTAMGPREDALRPLDRFDRIEDVLPLPHRLSTALLQTLPQTLPERRQVLVDLPAEDADRRFALFVQPREAAAASADAAAVPVLLPTYFILACQTAG